MNININTFNNIVVNNNNKDSSKPNLSSDKGNKLDESDYSPVFSPSSNSKKTKLRIMVIGKKGTGKTSFIETFIRYVGPNNSPIIDRNSPSEKSQKRRNTMFI